MAKITNPEALEAQHAIRQHIAMTIATLKAMDLAVRRDYRTSMVNLAMEVYQQSSDLGVMAQAFKGGVPANLLKAEMTSKEKV